MFDRLTVSNFQSHERLEIEFSPTITVLAGKSGSGKSACLRALGWLCFNRPRGDSFITWGESDATVSLWVDGHQITRSMGRGGNVYTLDGQEYRAFGTDVPQGIAQLLNLSDDNYSGQFANPFWFFNSSREVGKELNRIVNLDLIDKTLSNLASELRKAKANVELTHERYSQAKQQRRDLRWVVEADQRLREVEGLERRVGEKQSQVRELEGLLGKIGELRNQQQVEEGTIIQLEKLVTVGEQVLAKQREVEELEELLDRVRQCKLGVKETERMVQDLEKELGGAWDGKCPVCGGVWAG